MDSTLQELGMDDVGQPEDEEKRKAEPDSHWHKRGLVAKFRAKEEGSLACGVRQGAWALHDLTRPFPCTCLFLRLSHLLLTLQIRIPGLKPFCLEENLPSFVLYLLALPLVFREPTKEYRWLQS